MTILLYAVLAYLFFFVVVVPKSAYRGLQELIRAFVTTAVGLTNFLLDIVNFLYVICVVLALPVMYVVHYAIGNRVR